MFLIRNLVTTYSFKYTLEQSFTSAGVTKTAYNFILPKQYLLLILYK